MELMEKSDEDTSHWEPQLLDLTTKWERICKLSVRKQDRLDDALKTVSRKIDGYKSLLFINCCSLVTQHIANYTYFDCSGPMSLSLVTQMSETDA